jgi:hypothetical protein
MEKRLRFTELTKDIQRVIWLLMRGISMEKGIVF